jgi:hypothetical protein
MSPTTTSSFKLPNTPENRERLLKLSALLRELFERDEYRTVCTYVNQCSDLQDLHDEMAKQAEGSREYFQAYAAATKIYNNARLYALKNNLPHPNELLRACGYKV